MSNALSVNPPAPNPKPPQISQSGNALSAPNGSSSPGTATAQIPAPTHQQTAAALRHFDAIKSELIELLKDPDLGKADMKSKIIDGATKLVASGIVKPSDAVTQLGTVPTRPFEQKKWIEQQFAQTINSANAVLDHHRIANAGDATPGGPSNPDNHHDHISGLMGQYQNGG